MFRFLFVPILIASIIGCEKKQETPMVAPSQNAPAQTAPAAAGAQAPASTSASAQAPAKASLPGGAIKGGEQMQVGFIVWGGDVPMFLCNGGLETHHGTICDQYSLNMKMVPGDDMDAQIADYKNGKTPFLRGTYQMIAKHAAELCQNPDMCPVDVLQMTWSAGDHLVCRASVKDLKDLKGKTVALQKNGPHESFLLDILDDVGLKLTDVQVVWNGKLTADPDSPPSTLKNNSKVDCAFAISPDMIALTGGLTSKGSGAEGTVKDAHVLISTSDRRKSIPDVYMVRADYAKAHSDTVRNFAFAYLKSVERMKELEAEYKSSSGSPEFRALLAAVVDIYKGAGGTNEEEAYGLIQDASFVGHAGNVEFFAPENQTGHTYFNDRSRALLVALGGGETTASVGTSPVDWNHAVFKGLKSANVKVTPRFNAEAARTEIEALAQKGIVADNSMLSFTAHFAEDQVEFDETKYGAQFDEVLKLSRNYTRAPIVIRGHTDSTRLVGAILRAGMKAGVIQQSGNPGAYSYSIEGVALDLQNAKQILAKLHEPQFNAMPKGQNPTEIAEAARDLSLERAKKVRESLLAYAAKKGVKLDPSQVQINGAGAGEPFIVKPRSEEEAAKNRRVEFAIVRVSAEAATSSDYEL